MIREGHQLTEMLMELDIFYVEFEINKQQCGDGTWLAKIKSTQTYVDSSQRIQTRALRKIRSRNL